MCAVCTWAEDRDSLVTQSVGKAGHERRLGADDDQVDAGLLEPGAEVRCQRIGSRPGRPHVDPSGVAGDADDLVNFRTLCEFPAEGMFAAPAADHGNLHGVAAP